MTRSLAALLLVALLAAACGGDTAATARPTPSAPPPSARPSPSPSSAPSPTSVPAPSSVPSPTSVPSPSVVPSPSPSGSTAVTTAAQAVALVLASEPMFANVMPLTPELIGQCCWYEVVPSATGAGWDVSITIGWGDCFAGCIDRHTWTYNVAPDGTLTATDESGPEPPPDAVPGGGSGPATATVHVVAGPTCPVETVPPDPDCAPRPVANAEVVVRDRLGAELTRATSNANGSVILQLPAGVYVVEALPVEGLMGTPEPIAFSVTGGGVADLFVAYDTGIR